MSILGRSRGHDDDDDDDKALVWVIMAKVKKRLKQRKKQMPTILFLSPMNLTNFQETSCT